MVSAIERPEKNQKKGHPQLAPFLGGLRVLVVLFRSLGNYSGRKSVKFFSTIEADFEDPSSRLNQVLLDKAPSVFNQTFSSREDLLCFLQDTPWKSLFDANSSISHLVQSAVQDVYMGDTDVPVGTGSAILTDTNAPLGGDALIDLLNSRSGLGTCPNTIPLQRSEDPQETTDEEDDSWLKSLAWLTASFGDDSWKGVVRSVRDGLLHFLERRGCTELPLKIKGDEICLTMDELPRVSKLGFAIFSLAFGEVIVPLADESQKLYSASIMVVHTIFMSRASRLAMSAGYQSPKALDSVDAFNVRLSICCEQNLRVPDVAALWTRSNLILPAQDALKVFYTLMSSFDLTAYNPFLDDDISVTSSPTRSQSSSPSKPNPSEALCIPSSTTLLAIKPATSETNQRLVFDSCVQVPEPIFANHNFPTLSADSAAVKRRLSGSPSRSKSLPPNLRGTRSPLRDRSRLEETIDPAPRRTFTMTLSHNSLFSEAADDEAQVTEGDVTRPQSLLTPDMVIATPKQGVFTLTSDSLSLTPIPAALSATSEPVVSLSVSSSAVAPAAPSTVSSAILNPSNVNLSPSTLTALNNKMEELQTTLNALRSILSGDSPALHSSPQTLSAATSHVERSPTAFDDSDVEALARAIDDSFDGLATDTETEEEVETETEEEAATETEEDTETETDTEEDTDTD